MAAKWESLRCALYGPAVLPPLLAFGWTFVEACLRPRLIAGRDIERLADAVMAHHSDDPEEAAFVSEHAAWLRSAMAEQGTMAAGPPGDPQAARLIGGRKVGAGFREKSMRHNNLEHRLRSNI